MNYSDLKYRQNQVFLIIGLFACLLAFTGKVHAAPVVTLGEALNNCKTIYAAEQDSAKRLACYDSIQASKVIAVSPNIAAEDAAPEAKIDIALKAPYPNLSYLEKKWRLDSQGDWDLTDFETHHSNYLLVQTTNSVNNTPTTPTQPAPADRDLQSGDLQFQFSIKTELMKNIPIISNLPFVTSARLWGAYTQQSFWQVGNGNNSRPLRENDYQPEVILSLGLNNQVNGERLNYMPRLLNLGLVHESNGRDNPLSRSWNRIYLESGWQLTDRLSLMVRPWWRVPEPDTDDNPDIEKYLGYGDMNLRWENPSGKTAASLLLRNNLRSENKGYAKFDLSRKLYDDSIIKLHFMLTSGYGDSLLDYNHSQSTIGVGMSIGD
ncbi:MAG: phospholipase A [Methylophilaceae bacterium]